MFMMYCCIHDNTLPSVQYCCIHNNTLPTVQYCCIHDNTLPAASLYIILYAHVLTEPACTARMRTGAVGDADECPASCPSTQTIQYMPYTYWVSNDLVPGHTYLIHKVQCWGHTATVLLQVHHLQAAKHLPRLPHWCQGVGVGPEQGKCRDGCL